MLFKFIDPQGPEYDAECMLRWETFAKPLGLPPGSEIIPADKQSLHLIAIERNKIVGCVCYCAGEIFHMAVSEEYRGQGFGRQLLHMMEQSLSAKGVREIHVYVRQDNEGFYVKMGYQPEGDYLNRNGAQSRLMKKNLHA